MTSHAREEDKKTVTIATVRKWLHWLNKQECEHMDGDDGLWLAFKADDYTHFYHKIGQYKGNCDCTNCEELIQ